MKKHLLAPLLALASAATLWLSSAAVPSSPTPDPAEGPLPPEAFAKLDFDSVQVRNGGFQFWLYNGSDYTLTSFDFEVELTDFPWQGNEHNSRTWRLQGGTRKYGSEDPLRLSLWDYSLGFEVDPATVRVKVLSAEGFQR